mmetsp:Transcript_97511/g.232132  ORF Transcript_97511/g.232132 Transcript_97511/m.232132 type:complete len:281 (-) Transcript_97511:310-1152(-)
MQVTSTRDLRHAHDEHEQQDWQRQLSQEVRHLFFALHGPLNGDHADQKELAVQRVAALPEGHQDVAQVGGPHENPHRPGGDAPHRREVGQEEEGEAPGEEEWPLVDHTFQARPPCCCHALQASKVAAYKEVSSRHRSQQNPEQCDRSDPGRGRGRGILPPPNERLLQRCQKKTQSHQNQDIGHLEGRVHGVGLPIPATRNIGHPIGASAHRPDRQQAELVDPEFALRKHEGHAADNIQEWYHPLLHPAHVAVRERFPTRVLRDCTRHTNDSRVVQVPQPL